MRLTEKDIYTVAKFKKVHKEGATGMVQTQHKAMTLTLRIDKINYDTKAGSIRIGGQNVFGTEHVRSGAYHTLELRLQSKFRLEKAEWDSVALEQLKTATDPSATAEVAAVLLDDDGNALICLLTSALSIVRAQIDCNVPRKGHSVGSGRDQALEKFYVQVAQNIERHVNLQVVRCVIVASPGFVKDDFLKFFWTWCERNEKRAFLDAANRSKFVAVHSSSAKKHALSEILMDERMASKLADTKAALECRCLNEFFGQLVADARAATSGSGLVQAVYGLRQVERAAELQAVSKLLVLDDLFRHASVAFRRRYVALVDCVRRANPDRSDAALICSSQHTASERLRTIGGLAALLRYGLPESQFEDDQEEEELTFLPADEFEAAAAGDAGAAASESAADEEDVEEAAGQLDDDDVSEEGAIGGGGGAVSSAAAVLGDMDLDDDSASSFPAPVPSAAPPTASFSSSKPDAIDEASTTTTAPSNPTLQAPPQSQPQPRSQSAVAAQNANTNGIPTRAQPQSVASVTGTQSRTSKQQPQPAPLPAKTSSKQSKTQPVANTGGKRGGGGGKGKQRAPVRRDDDGDFIEDIYDDFDY